jgi:hypothetical protein
MRLLKMPDCRESLMIPQPPRTLVLPLPDTSQAKQFFLQNRAPKAGEPVQFARSTADDVTYADIAVVPNMERSGTVLILNGIDMVAVEAAGEFALSGALSSTLAGHGSRAEILLKIRSIAGTASKSEVIAIRDVAPLNTADLLKR